LWPEVVEHHGNDPVATAPGSDFVYPHSGHIVAIRVLTQAHSRRLTSGGKTVTSMCVPLKGKCLLRVHARVSPLRTLTHLELALAQDFDSVSQLGCLFKFKSLGRSTHLQLKPGNRRFDISRRVVFDFSKLNRYLEVVGL